MTGTLVYETTEMLDPDVKATFDSVLAPIGVQAVGSRSSVNQQPILVLKVVDPGRAPADFRRALHEALNSGEAADAWATFSGAVYN